MVHITKSTIVVASTFGANMDQIIVLNTYIGSSDFTFRATCTGRRLTNEEVLKKGFVTEDIKRRHKDSSYVYEWYEIKPTDKITLRHVSETVYRVSVFRARNEVKQYLNTCIDNSEATGMNLEDYLNMHCILFYLEDR